ncbi:hypothetical protein HED60_02920 [Planctomycetales bacterium ZRK34]|nr:hypothetical protein HED60_02920 [Planctomycetales bacterium ZRK34]
MTSKFRQAFTLIAAAGLCFAAAPAHAAFSLVDDFDSYTAGTNISGQGDWTSNSGSNDVVVDPAGASNNALYIGGGTTYNDAINIADGTTGTLFLRVRMPDGSLNSNFGMAQLAAPGAGVYDDFRAQVQVTGQLNVRDGGGFETLTTTDADPADNRNVWYNIWIVADNTADTVKVYAQSNGDSAFASQRQLTSGADEMNFRSASTALQSIYLVTQSASIYYDDFYLDASAQNQINPTYSVFVNEDFEDGIADGFTVYDTSGGSSNPDFQINAGVYSQANSNMDSGANGKLGGYALASPVVGAFTLDVDIRLDDVINDPGNVAADAGLVFGWQDVDNFYQLVFNEDAGLNEVFKIVAGVRTQIGSDFAPSGIQDGAFHNVVLDRNVATGGITLFIDGLEVFDLVDYTFGSGRVGIGSINDAASFDNFLLTAVPAPAALPAGLALMGLAVTRRRHR